jgi:8-oxo-dGTP diphosphatase
LESKRLTIASWYWENTDTYTVFVLARVKDYVEMPKGFETTGRVTMNIETARQMIHKIEGEGLRTELLDIVDSVIDEFISLK